MSYDFESLIKGVAVLNGKYQYKLFFIGDGVCRAKVENLINQYSVNAEITGFLKYGDLLKYLSYCDIAVNIFRDKTKVVHSLSLIHIFTKSAVLLQYSSQKSHYCIGYNIDGF